MKSPSQKFFINGQSGKLEVILAGLDSEHRRGLAVIAHPHPLYGGTMDNKVVFTLFKAALELGLIAVKFNFRGVGKSEGVYGEGAGEVEDVITVVTTIRDQFREYLDNTILLLAGFSFGGAIQSRAAQQLNPDTLLMVAPSVDHFSASPVITDVRRLIIIHGDKDRIVSLETILDWVTPRELPIIVVPGAEHFFHGKLHILRRIVLDSCRS